MRTTILLYFNFVVLRYGMNSEPGQGYRELVALSSTCKAYQRICGAQRQGRKFLG